MRDGVLSFMVITGTLGAVVLVPALLGYMWGGDEDTAWSTAIASVVVTYGFSLFGENRRG